MDTFFRYAKANVHWRCLEGVSAAGGVFGCPRWRAVGPYAAVATPASSARRFTVLRRWSGSGLIGETMSRSTPASP